MPPRLLIRRSTRILIAYYYYYPSYDLTIMGIQYTSDITICIIILHAEKHKSHVRVRACV